MKRGRKKKKSKIRSSERVGIEQSHLWRLRRLKGCYRIRRIAHRLHSQADVIFFSTTATQGYQIKNLCLVSLSFLFPGPITYHRPYRYQRYDPLHPRENGPISRRFKTQRCRQEGAEPAPSKRVPKSCYPAKYAIHYFEWILIPFVSYCHCPL